MFIPEGDVSKKKTKPKKSPFGSDGIREQFKSQVIKTLNDVHTEIKLDVTNKRKFAFGIANCNKKKYGGLQEVFF